MDDGSQFDGNGNHETLSERSIFRKIGHWKKSNVFLFL
jgi:hypothetical protein